MKAKFGANKKLQQSYTLPPVGNFALDVEPPREPKWDHCREQFAAVFTESTPGFFYSVHGGKEEDVASFLTKCEEIIGLISRGYRNSSFSKTNKDGILWVDPTGFWLNCRMKRSFLTMVLRCGLNYDKNKDNFDEALFSDKYKENLWARDTRQATMRFLFGFTRWTDMSPPPTISTVDKHGWHEEFKSLDNLTIRKKLALPDGEVMEASIIGVESLWA
jgi:hypothetical protein